MKQPTEQDKRKAALAITYAQLLLEHIDDLGFSKLYRHRVKNLCKSLVRELEPTVDKIFAKDGGSKEEVEASQQLIDLSNATHSITLAIMAIPQEKIEDADKDLKKVIKKYTH